MATAASLRRRQASGDLRRHARRLVEGLAEGEPAALGVGAEAAARRAQRSRELRLDAQAARRRAARPRRSVQPVEVEDARDALWGSAARPTTRALPLAEHASSASTPATYGDQRREGELLELELEVERRPSKPRRPRRAASRRWPACRTPPDRRARRAGVRWPSARRSRSSQRTAGVDAAIDEARASRRAATRSRMPARRRSRTRRRRRASSACAACEPASAPAPSRFGHGQLEALARAREPQRGAVDDQRVDRHACAQSSGSSASRSETLFALEQRRRLRASRRRCAARPRAARAAAGPPRASRSAARARARRAPPPRCARAPRRCPRARQRDRQREQAEPGERSQRERAPQHPPHEPVSPRRCASTRRTAAGSALPPVRFITWPIRKFSTFSSPAQSAATWPACSREHRVDGRLELARVRDRLEAALAHQRAADRRPARTSSGTSVARALQR